ncbi:MAG: hypothetical protein AMJ46_03190 [Latescibacteria bacterium DG_63]|nr:MAG: hypothetical protein AMJ46_03190 [Latescibacteria bacterium DG_63]
MRTHSTRLYFIVLPLFLALSSTGQLCTGGPDEARASYSPSSALPYQADNRSSLKEVTLSRTGALPPRLDAALRAAPDSTVSLWVFFRDKGSAAQVAGTIAELKDRFSSRALARRARVRKAPLLDWRDVPVPRPYIESLEDLGFSVRAISKWLNAVSVTCKAQDGTALLELPFVTEVKPVASFPKREMPFEKTPALPVTPFQQSETAKALESPSSAAPGDTSFYGATWRQLDMIQVPALHTQGITGDSVFIGVLDTGFNLNHEALESTQVVAQWDFINWDSVTSNEPGQDLSYQHNHGTMILGIIGGYKPGIYSGVAFGAEFALAKTEDVSDETPVEEDYWVMGLEWLDSLGVDLVTSSLGYKDWYTYEDMDGNTTVTTIAADMAVANGVSVFTAMGNGGATPYPYTIAPADGDSVMSIGAVDSLGQYWAASSRGPTYDGRIKPEIVTPGCAVYCVDPNDSTAYGRASGTSCATPLAAGGGALILQMNRDWNPVQLREAIRATGTNSSSPDTFIGWGILQADDASTWLLVSVLDEPLSPGAPGNTVIEVKNVPNPFNPHTVIHVELLSPAGEELVSAGIFDVTGRCVRDFGHLSIETGSAVIVWDGTDGSGRVVSSGTYFFTVKTSEASETRKLLLLR